MWCFKVKRGRKREKNKTFYLDYDELYEYYIKYHTPKTGFINFFFNQFKINQLDRNRNTLLHFACHNSFTSESIKYLLKHNINVNAKNNKNESALIIIYKYEINTPENIKVLLKYGADVNATDNIGHTALHHAVNNNTNKETISILLGNRTTNINAVNKYGATALHLAIRNLNLDMCQLLLSHSKLDSNFIDINGHTLFHKAVLTRRIDVVKFILPYIYDINITTDKGESALHLACSYDNEEIINFLLENNIDVNIMTNNGNLTALHMALHKQLHVRVIRSLIDKGANCHLSSNFNTTLQYTIEYGKLDILQLVLCRIDADHINEVNYIQESALHTAVRSTDEVFINLVLQKNIDVNLINMDKLTALQLALYERLNEKIIQSLIRHGANCNLAAVNPNYSILYLAIQSYNNDILKLILSQLNQDTLNHEKDQTLTTAVLTGNKYIVSTVLNKFIELNLTDFNGLQAFEAAVITIANDTYYRMLPIIELFLKHIDINTSYNNEDNTIIGALPVTLNIYVLKVEHNKEMVHLKISYDYQRQYYSSMSSMNPFDSEIVSNLFNIIELLLFEREIVIDYHSHHLISELDKNGIQLILLSLMKQNQLIHDTNDNEFYFHDATQELEEDQVVPFYNKYCDYNDLSLYFNELERMRTIEISPTHRVTYFQFLGMNKYQMKSLLLRSEEIIDALKNVNYIENEFPEYGWLILRKYLIGYNFYLANTLFKSYLCQILPTEARYGELEFPINLIIKLLTRNDIINFIDAFRGIIVHNQNSSG